jgi:hypothetical protein
LGQRCAAFWIFNGKIDKRRVGMSRSEEHLHPRTPKINEEWVYLSSLADSQLDNMKLKAIAELAYTYSEVRGRPCGSPEEDWFRAEHEFKNKNSSVWWLP